MISSMFSRLSQRPNRDRNRARTAMNRRRRLLTLEAMEERQLLSGIWTGAVDGNWSNPANWDNNAVPTALVPVVIDSANLTGASISAITLSGNAVARSLTINSGVSLDLDGYTLSVNTAGNAVASGYTQSGGTVDGSDAGSTLRVGGNFTHTAGSFDVENVEFVGVNSGTVTSNLTFNNVTINYGSHHITVASGQPLNVNGLLTFINYNTFTGDVYAYGDVTTENATVSSNRSYGQVYFKGAGPQSLSGTNGAGSMPRVVNQKPAAQTLTVTGTITPENWDQVSGKLSAAGSTVRFDRTAGGGAWGVNTGTTKLGNVVINSGGDHVWIKNLNVGGDLAINAAYTLQRGAGVVGNALINVDGDVTSSDTNVPSNNVELVLDANGGPTQTLTAAVPGAQVPDLKIDKWAWGYVQVDPTHELTVNGHLTVTNVNSINGGTLNVLGNVVTTDTNVAGSATIKLDGNHTINAGGQNGQLPNLLVTGTGATNASNAAALGVQSLTIDAGATFKAPPGLRIAKNLTIDGSYVHNNGLVTFATDANSTVAIANPAANPLYDVKLAMVAWRSLAISGEMQVAHDLNVTAHNSSNLNGGNVVVGGDVVTTSQAGGSATIVFSDNGAHTINAGGETGGLPNVLVSDGTVDASGSGTLTVRRDLTVSGGSFGAPSGTLAIGRNLTVAPPGLFQHNNGTVKFINSSGNSGNADIGSATLYDVTFAMSAWGNLNVVGTMNVANDVLIQASSNSRLNGGDIAVSGDVLTQSRTDGSATILFNGTGNQNLSAAPTGGWVPNVRINKTGGTLSFGTDPIGVVGDWTYVKGAVDESGSTIAFVGDSNSTIDAGTSPAMSFHNVVLDKSNVWRNVTITNKLPVNNDLTINGVYGLYAAPGKITVGGDLTSTDASVGGTADITMITPTAASIIGGDFPNGGIIINKGSSANVTASVTQPLDGPLTLINLSSLKGTFQVGRDVETRDAGIVGNSDGSPVLVFKGNKHQQLIVSVANGMVPGVEIDKNGGSLTLAPEYDPQGGGPYALQVSGGWIVDGTNSAPVNLTDTRVRFMLHGGYGDRTIDTGGSAGFDDVEIQAGSGAKVTIGTMVVNGDLTLASASQINGGNIDVHGDVTATGATAMLGNSRVRFVGSNNQTLSATADNRRMIGVIIEKTAGTLTIDGTYWIDVTGHWDYNSGIVAATTSKIKFVGGTKIIRPGSMVFGDVNFAVGSSDHVEILDAFNNAAVLHYWGTATNTHKVTTGSVQDDNP